MTWRIARLDALSCICSFILGTIGADGWQEMRWILEVDVEGPAWAEARIEYIQTRRDV